MNVYKFFSLHSIACPAPWQHFNVNSDYILFNTFDHSTLSFDILTLSVLLYKYNGYAIQHVIREVLTAPLNFLPMTYRLISYKFDMT